MIVANNTMRVMGTSKLLPHYALSQRLVQENEDSKNITLKFTNVMGAVNKVNNSEEGISVLKSLFSAKFTKETTAEEISVEDDVEIPETAVIEDEIEEQSVGEAEPEVEAEKKDWGIS